MVRFVPNGGLDAKKVKLTVIAIIWIDAEVDPILKG